MTTGPEKNRLRGWHEYRPAWRWLSIVFLIGFTLCQSLKAATITAQTAVGATDVFLGESFEMQIQISGSDQPGRPNLAGLHNFTVQPNGGGPNNSSSVTIINGRMTQSVKKSYILNYRLTPKRTGRVIIPAITLTVEGQTVRTGAVAINVQKPMEIDNFKLVLELSKPKVYVGEPVRLRLVWYIGHNVRNIQFNLPLLNEDGFYVTNPRTKQQPEKKYHRIALNGDEVIGVQSAGQLAGKNYMTLSVDKILIPQKAGRVSLLPATVAFEVKVGSRPTRSQGLFSGVFGRQNQDVYKKSVIPSNALTLEVADLPVEGRPSKFSGHVGNYQIETTAIPTEVNVGDPITLTISISGTEFLDHIDLPPLQEQTLLASNFKIPNEIEAGKYDGVRKVFTQTVRAQRSDIDAIPPIELPYFDTGEETYKVARSKPIPIKVRETKVVTASDAEGLSAENAGATAVEAWARGIAHNYESLDTIVDQRLGAGAWLQSPVWLSMVGAPPVAYGFLLAGVFLVRRRNSDPQAVRARRVFSEVNRELEALGNDNSDATADAVSESLRKYLGAKLRMSHGALTFNDVAELLTARGVDPAVLEDLQQLIKKCEASRYAGGGSGGNTGVVASQCLALVQKLERVLK